MRIDDVPRFEREPTMLRTADESGLGERWVNRQSLKYEDAQLLELLTRPRAAHLPPPDVDAPTVLRVVSVFDELVEGCASAADLVRSVSRWTDCAAGLSGPDGQVLARCDRQGARLAGGEPTVSTSREAYSHGVLSARLWIERDGPASPLDEVVLARGARAGHQILERMTQVAAVVSPIPGLVEILIDADVSVSRRSRACRELGYEPNQAITVAVAQATGGRAAVPARVGRRIQSSGGGRVRVADFGVSAILVTSGAVDADTLVLAGMERRVGIGPARPAIDAPRSYHGARAALRFAQGPGAPPIAQFDQLGSVTALAGVVDTDLIDFPDWVALVELSRTETGVTAILTAEILMRTGSQREAAARMNLHHSTVAHRVGHVEQALGYGLGEHSNWFRAQLAIHLWRLSWPDPLRTASSARWRMGRAEVPPSA
jgi:hypothetical protein